MVAIQERTVRTVMTVTVRGSIDPEINSQAARQVQNEQYRLLAVAVVQQAVRDAKYKPRGLYPEIKRKRTLQAGRARRWLASEDCAWYLEALSVDRGAVLGWLTTLPELPVIDNDFQLDDSEGIDE